MTLFHHNGTPSSTATATKSDGQSKRRLSLFSFGSSTKVPPARLSTLPNSTSPLPADSHVKISTKSPSSPSNPNSPSESLAYLEKNDQLDSPVCSPVMESNPLSQRAGSQIFERSVQDLTTPVKQEDYIPPALDATAEILGDKDTNLDEVEMIFSSRRNSSVIGLNMALGRPYTPLRKNSVYSMNQAFGNNGTINSASSLSNQPQSPVSPPKLYSSRSSVSFYSYADMINNDEFSRRPSIMHSYSHSVVPTIGRKTSVVSNHSVASNNQTGAPSLPFNKISRKLTLQSTSSVPTLSQLSKQLVKDRVAQANQQRIGSKANEQEYRNLNKFLISPESSDSEDQEPYFPEESVSSSSRKKSFSSTNSAVDSESLVSFSAGDRIRQCTTEISGY